MDLQNYLKTNFEKAKEGNWAFDDFLSKIDDEIWSEEKQDGLRKKQHNKNLEETIMTLLKVFSKTSEDINKVLEKVDFDLWSQKKQDSLIKEQKNKNLEETIMTLLKVFSKTFEDIDKVLEEVDLDLEKTEMQSDEELYAIEKENYIHERNAILLKNNFKPKKISLEFNNVQVFENTFYDDFTNKDKTVKLIFKSDEPNLLVLNTMSYDIASRYIKSSSEHLLAYLDVDNTELLENVIENIV